MNARKPVGRIGGLWRVSAHAVRWVRPVRRVSSRSVGLRVIVLLLQPVGDGLHGWREGKKPAAVLARVMCVPPVEAVEVAEAVGFCPRLMVASGQQPATAVQLG